MTTTTAPRPHPAATALRRALDKAEATEHRERLEIVEGYRKQLGILADADAAGTPVPPGSIRAAVEHAKALGIPAARIAVDAKTFADLTRTVGELRTMKGGLTAEAEEMNKLSTEAEMIAARLNEIRGRLAYLAVTPGLFVQECGRVRNEAAKHPDLFDADFLANI